MLHYMENLFMRGCHILNGRSVASPVTCEQSCICMVKGFVVCTNFMSSTIDGNWNAKATGVREGVCRTSCLIDHAVFTLI